MLPVSCFIAKSLVAGYAHTSTLPLAAASDNFELSIAVSVVVFGINSTAAFAAMIGPLIDVPAMIGLVKAADLLRQRKFQVNNSPRADPPPGRAFPLQELLFGSAQCL